MHASRSARCRRWDNSTDAGVIGSCTCTLSAHGKVVVMIFALVGLGMLGNLVNTFTNVLTLWQALQKAQMAAIAKRMSERAAAAASSGMNAGGGLMRSMSFKSRSPEPGKKGADGDHEQQREDSTPLTTEPAGASAKVHPEGAAEPEEPPESAFKRFQKTCGGGFLIQTATVFTFQMIAAAIILACEQEENGEMFDTIWNAWYVFQLPAP